MKLYRKDSKGKIRILEITASNDQVIQKSGLLDGKQVTHKTQCHAKNIGKKNETTASQQAVLKKQSIITRKIREGYFTSKEAAETTDVVKPMLAKSEGDHGDKIIFPCFAQPKLDGMRMLGKEDKKLSRENKEIDTLDHIDLTGLEQFIDGEAYAHGFTFQENMKLIKKYRKGETENVKFHVYDLISDDKFEDRYETLKELVESLNSPYVELVETIVINNREELQTYHEKNLLNGFEGTMIRWGEDGYKVNGRSDKLLKYKDFKDVALPTVDIVESDRVPGHGIVVIEYNGHRSKTGSKISHEDRKDLWTNRDKYIGKTAEIRYFEETDKGALRFPIFMGFRIDK